MVGSSDLDDGQILLLAVQLVAESSLIQLQLLANEQRDILTSDLLCRLLLNYLPPDAESIPSLLTFLRHLEQDFKSVSSLDETLDTSAVQALNQKESSQRLHELRISSEEQLQDSNYDDSLGAFIVQWLHRVEQISGIPPMALQLTSPFVQDRPKLMQWQHSVLAPLLKLQNDFYPTRAESLDTQTLETLQGVPGVRSLLQFAEQDGDKAQIGRDLDEVVTPWVCGANKAKRRRLSQSSSNSDATSWRDVNEWIYTTSIKNFDLAVKSFLEWNGPREDLSPHSDLETSHGNEVSLSYIQTGLALITTSTGTGQPVNTRLRQILDRAASMSVAVASGTVNGAKYKLSDASKVDLLENSILRPLNPITYPSEEVFRFLDSSLASQQVLESFKIPLPMVALVDTALFGSEERQKQELLRILQQIPRLTRSDIDWPHVRQQLHTLQSSQGPPHTEPPSTSLTFLFLGRVSSTYLESEFLDALIANNQYTIVNDIYLETPDPPLEQAIVQEHIISAIYSAYDNSTNGNRTRGGMKRAHELLKAFQPKFASSPTFNRLDHLIRATHSLSFYQLTLQHGVIFQPATIRIHHDPISLVEKVLAQNHKAYTKLDDLLEIGNNLVRADLPNSEDTSHSSKSLDERIFDAQHRITYLAITSALSDHDFDTAYSYITTRLATSPSQTSKSPFTDNTSWRAAYAAGRYRPSSSPKTLHGRITGLSKRMDLLSLALTLAPTSEPLPEILAVWRRCEEEMDSLKTQAVDEERAVDRSQGNSLLPGGFAEDRDIDAAETRRMMERRALSRSGPSYEEEAPMGLFDVARGAASAFRKSAFPLRGAGGQINVKSPVERETGGERDSLDEPRSSGEHQRVRKRDMVSNMVTGGLVSGMSWVLGAPPSGKQGNE